MHGPLGYEPKDASHCATPLAASGLKCAVGSLSSRAGTLACSKAGGFGMISSISPKAKPPWPNGQGVGPLIRRLRVRVPQEVRMSWIYVFLLCCQGSMVSLVEPSCAYC